MLTNNGFINKINFPELAYLNLSHNYLNSINNIAHSFIPNLSRLSLNSNQITNFTPLMKSKWPEMQQVYLCKPYQMYR